MQPWCIGKKKVIGNQIQKRMNPSGNNQTESPFWFWTTMLRRGVPSLASLAFCLLKSYWDSKSGLDRASKYIQYLDPTKTNNVQTDSGTYLTDFFGLLVGRGHAGRGVGQEGKAVRFAEGRGIPGTLPNLLLVF